MSRASKNKWARSASKKLERTARSVDIGSTGIAARIVNTGKRPPAHVVKVVEDWLSHREPYDEIPKR